MTTLPDKPTPEQWAAHKAANADEFGVYPPDRDGIQFQGNPGSLEIKGVDWPHLIDRFFEAEGIAK